MKCSLLKNSQSCVINSCVSKRIEHLIYGASVHETCNCGEILSSFYHTASLKQLLENRFIDAEDVVVSGSFLSRFALLRFPNTRIFLSFRTQIQNHPYIQKNIRAIEIEEQNECISRLKIPDLLVNRLKRPHIKLVSLYHPENFPLPRFALGISDIAFAIRESFLGQVTLTDMQLGKTINDIYHEISHEKPDIIGISATFGQQDLLEKVIKRIKCINDYFPLIIVGGSLAALNGKKLIESYPELIVCIGPGEYTMSNIVRFWHKEVTLKEVPNILYIHDGQIFVTDKFASPNAFTGIPDLELLIPTLQHRGVMQLESSRGCANACSFCPRKHKGTWVSLSEDLLENSLPDIAKIYESFPETAKKIFLVDEEFFGYKEQNLIKQRVTRICDTFYKYGFNFETNSRIDQVYRIGSDKKWHVNRMMLWRFMVRKGLHRVLFGVESGIDSILDRFNKNIKSRQNVNAIRILSTCKIPTRFTYITFDPLMTLDELIGNFLFQGRDDLLLKPRPDLNEEEIFDAIHDEGYVKQHSCTRKLYQEISYMLVSMECLIGSKYLSIAEKHGLAGKYNYHMGKREVRYLDERIGLMSHNSQMWIDRNFSLDYTLKSIEKISLKSISHEIRELRLLLKNYSYALLSKFIAIATKNFDLIPAGIDTSNTKKLSRMWDGTMQNYQRNQKIFEELMDEHFSNLITVFDNRANNIINQITLSDGIILHKEIKKWKSKTNWELINAS